MKNKLRSRAYFKIKRTINSCLNAEQLDIALTMIALHPSVDESQHLHQIHLQKVETLQNSPTSIFEDYILTGIHKKLSP